MKISTLTLSVFLSLVLAACANGGKNTGAAADTPAAPQKQATEKAPPQKQAATPATGDVQKVMSKDGDFEGEVVGKISPKSKFAKLKIGMSRRQTESLIGMPSDMKTYQTGKAWIPIGGLFSKDTYRFETFYKGEGRLVFAKNGEKLFRIQVDTTEDGFQ